MVNNRFLIRLMSASHVFWYRLTGGRLGGRIGRAPVLLLTTIGRKTGKRRTTPLIYQRDGDAHVVVASNAGDDKPPIWWLNLQANPSAEIQVGPNTLAVRASKATLEEKQRYWPKLTAVYRTYDNYQKRTSREFDLVMLRPES